MDWIVKLDTGEQINCGRPTEVLAVVELCNRHEIGYDIVTPSGALFRDIGNVERMAFFEGYNSATNDAVDGPLNANRAWKAYKKEG